MTSPGDWTISRPRAKRPRHPLAKSWPGSISSPGVFTRIARPIIERPRLKRPRGEANKPNRDLLRDRHALLIEERQRGVGGGHFDGETGLHATRNPRKQPPKQTPRIAEPRANLSLLSVVISRLGCGVAPDPSPALPPRPAVEPPLQVKASIRRTNATLPPRLCNTRADSNAILPGK